MQHSPRHDEDTRTTRGPHETDTGGRQSGHHASVYLFLCLVSSVYPTPSDSVSHKHLRSGYAGERDNVLSAQGYASMLVSASSNGIKLTVSGRIRPAYSELAPIKTELPSLEALVQAGLSPACKPPDVLPEAHFTIRDYIYYLLFS